MDSNGNYTRHRLYENHQDEAMYKRYDSVLAVANKFCGWHMFCWSTLKRNTNHTCKKSIQIAWEDPLSLKLDSMFSFKLEGYQAQAKDHDGRFWPVVSRRHLGYRVPIPRIPTARPPWPPLKNVQFTGVAMGLTEGNIPLGLRRVIYL